MAALKVGGQDTEPLDYKAAVKLCKEPTNTFDHTTNFLIGPLT